MTVVWCESVYSCLYSAPWVLRQHLSCFVLQLALHVLWCIVTPCCDFHFALVFGTHLPACQSVLTWIVSVWCLPVGLFLLCHPSSLSRPGLYSSCLFLFGSSFHCASCVVAVVSVTTHWNRRGMCVWFVCPSRVCIASSVLVCIPFGGFPKQM